MFSFPYFCYYCIVSVLSRIVWVIRKCQNFFQWFIDLAVETHMYPTYILVCLFGNLSNSRGTNHLLYFCGIIPDRKKNHFFYYSVTTTISFLSYFILQSFHFQIGENALFVAASEQPLKRSIHQQFLSRSFPLCLLKFDLLIYQTNQPL